MILVPRNPLRLDAAGLFVGAQRNSQTEGVSLSGSGCCEGGATERGQSVALPLFGFNHATSVHTLLRGYR